MKVGVVQPSYSFNACDLKKCTAELYRLLDSCDDSMDIIVLPEYSDVLADVPGKAAFYDAFRINNAALIGKCRDTAKRCKEPTRTRHSRL